MQQFARSAVDLLYDFDTLTVRVQTPEANDLFKPLIYFILHLAFVFIVQFVFPAFCGMEKTSYHTIYPAALPLEQPANRTTGKMNG